MGRIGRSGRQETEARTGQDRALRLSLSLQLPLLLSLPLPLSLPPPLPMPPPRKNSNFRTKSCYFQFLGF